MKGESKSLLFMMAAAIKSGHTSSVPEAFKSTVVESLKFSGQRLAHLESETKNSPELSLLLYMCALPFHESLTPTILNLEWEIIQLLLVKEP